MTREPPADVTLPTVVRPIGVCVGSSPVRGPPSRRGSTEPTAGVLQPFHGVLDAGVGQMGGLPPSLTYLALPSVVAMGLPDRGGADRRGADRPGSPEHADGSPGADDGAGGDEPPTVGQVLRAERSDRSETDAGADGAGSSGPAEGETPEGGRPGRRSRTDPGPVRELRRLDDGPPALRSATGPGTEGSDRVRSPPTVLATAAVPGRTAGPTAPSGGQAIPVDERARDASRRSQARATGGRPSGADAASPEAAGTASDADASGRSAARPDARTGPGSAGSTPGSRFGAPTTVASRGAASTPDGTAAAPEAATGPPGSVATRADRAGSTVTATQSGRGRAGDASAVPLTVLAGARGDASGADAGRGSADSAGRSARSGAPEAAGTSDGSRSRGAGPPDGDGAAVTSPTGRAGSDADPRLPRAVSLDGGGPDGRFVEALHRELVRIERIERRRRGI